MIKIEVSSDRGSTEQLRAEIDIRIQEYIAIREEMVKHLEAAFQTTNVTLVAIAAILTVAAFLSNSGLISIVGIFSIIFHIIAWTQLRYIQQAYHLSKYIIDFVSPNIRKALSQIHPKECCRTESILYWESRGKELTHRNNLIFSPIEGSRYLLPYFSAVISFTVYLAILGNRRELISVLIDYPIITANVILIVYTSWATLKMRSIIKK